MLPVPYYSANEFLKRTRTGKVYRPNTSFGKGNTRWLSIVVVYVTSGDDGPDETGSGLHGDALGEVREKEALQTLQAIGIQNPPVFLRFSDSHVFEHVEAVQRALYEPSDGGAVAAYRVESRKQMGGEWQLISMTIDSQVVLADQERGVDLDFQVVAVNRTGKGEPSNIVSAIL